MMLANNNVECLANPAELAPGINDLIAANQSK